MALLFLLYVLITLALLLNYKSIPLTFFIRLAYHIYPHIRRLPWNHANTNGQANVLRESTTMTSLCTLGEIDHNMHKSNATFFVDMDISRAQCLTKLISPALMRKDPANLLKSLEGEGHRGPFGVVLGAVHASFCREVKPYARYVVETKVSGWDRKWLVMETSFWRPVGRKVAGSGGERVLLARGVSKFVFKKGRFTVPPGRVFAAAGLCGNEAKISQVDSKVDCGGGIDAKVDAADGMGVSGNCQLWLDFSSQLVAPTAPRSP